VASLAGRIFEQMTEPLGLQASDRMLLEWAARLQDVGYVINYEQHHKHSYHLIRNSRLPGIRTHDLELIANVARYHRGAHPKRKHDNLSRLSSEDQQRVQRMAAILRVAGGLDRSRSQQVRDVHVTVADECVTLDVVAEQEPLVDIWGAERRTDLFEKVFGLPAMIRWASRAGTLAAQVGSAAVSRKARKQPKHRSPSESVTSADDADDCKPNA
jgi:exopolyphosphatase/guanosine-5'-triphosphate,3'-diphosphate pyrophosphatase